MTQKKYFGTDGIRAKVGEGLINPEFVLKLGWAAGKVLARHQSAVVLIGKDTRISGYMLESALEAGFSAAGVNILLLGPMPTPAIAYLTQSIRAAAGVVISASHNPYNDNGIKFFDRNGHKLSDVMEHEIEILLDAPMQTVASEHLGKAARMEDAAGRYIEFCKSTFPSDLSLKGLSVVVDCANGATYAIAPKIFHELGAEVKTVAVHPDGVNINKQCGATATDSLRQAVLSHQADLGIALDGDGDRVIMIDHHGERVDGDELLGIIALHAMQEGRKLQGVVGTVMSNGGLEHAICQAGMAFERSYVGDRHVLAMLKTKGWQLGGEASGHIVDLRYTTTGDGIVAALQVLRIVKRTGQSLFSLKQVLCKRPQVLLNVAVNSHFVLSDHPSIVAAIADVKQTLGKGGQVLLRPSGTEPVVRVMVEGENHQLVDQGAQHLARLVSDAYA